MRKPLLLATLLSALALALSVCDVSTTPTAAKVGGAAIPVDRLNNVLQAVRDDGQLRCIFAGQGVNYTGAGDGNFDATFTAARLSELIELQLEDNLVAKLHLSRGSFASQTAEALLATTFSPANTGSCVSITANETPTQAGAAFVQQIPSAYRSVLLRKQVDDVVLDAHTLGMSLTTEGVAAYALAHQAELSSACVSLIVLKTKQDATKVAGQIQRGASFSSLAKADSSDAGSAANGGAIGCYYPDELRAPIGGAVEELPTGALSAPVSFNGSWLLLQVTSRQAAGSASQAVQVLFSSLNPQADSLVTAYQKQAGVEVNPSYGGLTAAAAGNTGALVNAPIGPGDTYLINPTAISPTSGG